MSGATAAAVNALPHRVVSWNIGKKGLVGLAAAQPNSGGLRAVFEALGHPAILALQETKLSGLEKLTSELANVPGYTSFFSYCDAATGGSLVRASYAGTATYVRHDVRTLAAAPALGAALRGALPLHTEGEADRLSPHLLTLSAVGDVDNEGRALLTDHGTFVLVNIYAPASGREGERPGYKRAFHEALSARCDALHRRGRQVLLLGDLNVVALPIDTAWKQQPAPPPQRAAPQQQQQQGVDEQADDQQAEAEDAEGQEEDAWSKREWFHSQLEANGGSFVDCFRRAHPARTAAYTFWSVVSRCKKKVSASLYMNTFNTTINRIAPGFVAGFLR